MRRAFVLLSCLIACKGKTGTPAATGSASPGSAAPLPAADAAPAVDAAPAIDAAAAAAGPTLSAKGGLSTIGKFDWSKQDENATAELLEHKLGLPGITVKFDVMDVPGDVEREEGYWSVKRGDDEIIQVLRTQAPDGDGPAALVIWTPDIPTNEGIKVGDTVATLLAKHPNLTCAEATIAETVPVDIQCTAPPDEQLGYIINSKKAKLKPGKPVDPKKIANVDIVGLSHEFGP